MVYTEYDKLTVIKLEKETDLLSFNEIAGAVLGRPSNMVYCELDGRLFGIISMGDVARASDAGLQEVPIQKKFTVIYRDEYMKARQIFRNQENINAIPVIDARGVLLGDYARWDDLFALDDSLAFGDEYFGSEFFRGRGRRKEKIVLVRPCSVFAKMKAYFEKWKEEFECRNIAYEVVDIKKLPEYFEKNCIVLFCSEDEWRGTDTFYSKILGKDINNYCRRYTYRFAAEEVKSHIYKEIEGKTVHVFLKELEKEGVSVLGVRVEDNGSRYYKEVREQLHRKYIVAGQMEDSRLPFPAYKDFLAELYTEKYMDISLPIPVKSMSDMGANRLKDVSEKFLNVKNGERLTVGQPEHYGRTVYFYGPCIMMGTYVDDEHTIESFLQIKLKDAGSDVRVVNLGALDNEIGTMNRILQTRFKEGDIVVVYVGGVEFEGINNLNLTDALERSNAPAEWFADALFHCNHKVNEIYAGAIYEKLKLMLGTMSKEKRKEIKINANGLVTAYLYQYFRNFNTRAYSKIGAIVMNCNPFTYGHRYLIEYALTVVDYLIIFVVEEDRSLFTFDERYAFVREGVKDLKNVKAVPSGQFILSKGTFPEYFVKIADDDIVHNVEYDITLFAEQIAPKLNITYRFVGEEPEDTVTNEYNMAMKRILPKNGIEVVEIPRKKVDGKYISATTVRKCLEMNDVAELERLVPERTKNLLFLQNA